MDDACLVAIVIAILTTTTAAAAAAAPSQIFDLADDLFPVYVRHFSLNPTACTRGNDTWEMGDRRPR